MGFLLRQDSHFIRRQVRGESCARYLAEALRRETAKKSARKSVVRAIRQRLADLGEHAS